jgi:cation diffusion facilitator CzcD-associated flavoprotein CzcO
VVVVECGSKVGGTYVNKTYEGSTLVSSTYLTAFSDYRLPEGPEHMTTDE